LLRQIHALALSYHWSERDLLSMPFARRLAYLMLHEEDRDAALVSGFEPRRRSG